MAKKKESTLYYFYSVGCGFCKKVDPIVDELNKEGHNILRLDLAESDNQGLKKELETKYKVPLTFNQSIGFKVEDERNKELIKMERHPIVLCAETKYADEMIKTGFPMW